MRKKVLEQTGPMFSNFDAETKASVQADLDFIAASAPTFNTEEINGLEDKLVSTIEEPAKEVRQEDVEEPEIEPIATVNDTTFDMSLEKMVLDALTEQEPLEKDAPKGDTDFIIADLDEIKEPEEQAFEVVPEEIETSLEEEKTEDVSADQVNIPIKRVLTKSEKEMFGSIAQTKEVQEQVSNAIDNSSLNPCLGNVVIMGERGTGTLTVAKNLIKMISVNIDEFSGKVANITGQLLNSKSIPDTLYNLENGALIIEEAEQLEDAVLTTINEYLVSKKEGGVEDI